MLEEECIEGRAGKTPVLDFPDSGHAGRLVWPAGLVLHEIGPTASGWSSSRKRRSGTCV